MSEGLPVSTRTLPLMLPLVLSCAASGAAVRKRAAKSAADHLILLMTGFPGTDSYPFEAKRPTLFSSADYNTRPRRVIPILGRGPRAGPFSRPMRPAILDACAPVCVATRARLASRAPGIV